MRDDLREAFKLIHSVLGENSEWKPELAAMLLLEEDAEIFELLRKKDPVKAEIIEGIVKKVNEASSDAIEYRLAVRHREHAVRIAKSVTRHHAPRRDFSKRLDEVLMHPVSGGIVVALVLYFGIYQIVGVFGAGKVVNFLEQQIFGNYINPALTRFFEAGIPWPIVRDLFTGEYGVLTLGLRYAVSLILPIVTFFFLVFSVIEDSGYLPRLAMLMDRLFKRLGLSGRAVIPTVLGFGCVTMATLVTRTLATKRERVIATILLTLAVPCSAQFGVILALLSPHPKALALWAFTMVAVFAAAGTALSKMLPGQAPSFYMELPPLRFPVLANVVSKTLTRVKWYLIEVLPLFLWASVFIWAGKLTGIFDRLTAWLAHPLSWMGLPPETAPAFLFGFFRRDYGAAGLYDLDRAGLLSAQQLFVACVTLTLFLPCIAQFLMNLKERGWKVGAVISVFTLFFSVSTAIFLHRLLQWTGVQL